MNENPIEGEEKPVTLTQSEAPLPRVRFSCIPIGSPSLVEARLALINYTVAQIKNGVFVFRIDDTHPEKTTPEAFGLLQDDLKWLGISWQEGPEVGGSVGPYRQLERTSIYQKHLQQLLSQGKAYPCYCSPEKLDEERLRFLAAGKSPRYNGHCRDLSSEKKLEAEAQGMKPAIRLKVDRQIVKFHDMIYGDFAFDSDTIGDWVLGLADGRFTASFVSVIDDATMKISQVIRGENELSQTATQILLYRAFQWEPPTYAHVPLLLAPDRTLLSKKHGISQVADLKSQGFLAPAVIQYLLQLGSSQPEGRKLPKLEEIQERFSLEKMSRSAPIFDLEELKKIQAHYLRQIPDSEFFQKCREFIPAAAELGASKGEEWLQTNLLLLKEKCRTFQEIGEYLGYFLSATSPEEEGAKKALELKDAPRLLKLMTEEITKAETLDLETLHQLMENAKQKLKSKSKNIFSPLQVALTGRSQGPDLALVATLLGKEETLKRIDHVLTSLQHPAPK
jgi:glutamyl-tRNA synthetase